MAAQKAFIIKQVDEGTPVAEIWRRMECGESKVPEVKDLRAGPVSELVRGMCGEWAVSIWTACGVISPDCLTFYHKSRRTDQLAVAIRIKEICETCVRSGCKRVHVFFDREGWGANVMKV